MKLTLAVDQSTSATKAMLFDGKGQVVAKASLPHAQHYPQPGWVEHDAEEIYRNTVAVIQQLLAQRVADADSIAWLSITNQRETIVIFDKATGAPLYPAMVWQCRRAAPICAEMVAQGHNEVVERKTGLKIDTYFPAAKLTWLFAHNPAIGAKVAQGEALIGTIDAYLLYRLTDGRTFATDSTNASRTLLFDIGTLQWDSELCDLFGVPMAALPEVRESGAHFGDTDLNGLLPAPLPIMGVMGDSQAALFGQHCFTPGSGKATLGTGTSMLINSGHTFTLAGNGMVTALGWVWRGTPTYVLEGLINFSGGTIAWLTDQLGLIRDAAESEPLALSVADNGGVYLVPGFVGLSAPYWSAEARGLITGLTPASTKAHVVRAALEAIAYNIQDVLVALRDTGAVDVRSLHTDGGMVTNRFLLQFIADMIQLPVRASMVAELSAWGAVLAGYLGTGQYDTVEALPHAAEEYVDYLPQMDSATATTYLQGWHTAVQRAL